MDLLDLFPHLCYNLQIMKRIWSPWRMKYIENHEKQEGCIFCNALARVDNAENLIIKRGTLAFVILNLYPYTSGHIMVAPMAHQPSLEFLDPASRAEMMELVSQSIVVLKKYITRRRSTSAQTSGKQPEPGNRITCTCTSSHAGKGTRILCPPWLKRVSCPNPWKKPTIASKLALKPDSSSFSH